MNCRVVSLMKIVALPVKSTPVNKSCFGLAFACNEIHASFEHSRAIVIQTDARTVSRATYYIWKICKRWDQGHRFSQALTYPLDSEVFEPFSKPLALLEIRFTSFWRGLSVSFVWVCTEQLDFQSQYISGYLGQLVYAHFLWMYAFCIACSELPTMF